MKQIIFPVLFLFSFLSVHTYGQMSFSLYSFLEEDKKIKTFDPEFDNSIFFIGRKSIPNLEQSPISFNGWQYAEITAFDGKIFKIEGRYLLSSDVMEIRFEDYHVTLYPSKIKHIQLADRYFIPSLFEEKDLKAYSYFEVLCLGEITLVKKYNLDYDKQVLKQDIYYKKQDGIAKAMFSNKRKLLKLFGNSSKLMKKYISDHNLNFRSENDLVKIFDFYNSTSGWASNQN